MALDAKRQERLSRLLTRLSDETMRPVDWAELNALLAETPAAVDRYLEHQFQEALLQREFGGARPVPIPPSPLVDAHDSPVPDMPGPAGLGWIPLPTISLVSGAVLLMGLLLLAIFFLVVPDGTRLGDDDVAGRPSSRAVAEISADREAVWAKGQSRPVEAELAAGDGLELEAGLVEVTFRSGARAVLEGPASFQVDSVNSGTLRHGKMAARVGETARGFAVNALYATITDFGTEFGVEVRDEAARVAVYEGEVEVAVALRAADRRTVRVGPGGVAAASRAGILETSPTGAQATHFVRDIGPPEPRIGDIALTGPEGGLVGEVPFQSHNQKVVANENGIFVTHAEGILQRSTDGGRTFNTIFNAAIEGLKPPTLETDEDGNIYLIYPEPAQRRTRFLQFTAANGYTAPVISKAYTEASSASCFASAYDRARGQFYHATQWGHMLILDKSGNLLRSRQMFSAGSNGSSPSYPYLFVDEFGAVHYAMTTADRSDVIPYETIRYLTSSDGGQTWCRIGGEPVSLPTRCDPDGPSTMINLPEEVRYNTWLAGMHAKNGKVHFMYLTRNPANAGKPGGPPKIDPRQHYMRFDVQTGEREIDRWADCGNAWKGETLRIHSVCGFFVSDPFDPEGPLFAVGALDAPGWKGDPRKLAALVSYDNGTTWQDYAVSDDVGKVWAEGGFRCITQQGKVIGTFAAAKPKWATTLFFQFDTSFAKHRK